MKMLLAEIALSVAVTLAFLLPAKPSVAQQLEAPRSIVEQVEDATRFKLLWMDSVENLLGTGWQDRETAEIGLVAIRRAMDRVLSKYGFRLPTKEADFEFDLPKPLEVGGAGYQIYIVVPDRWFELYHLKNWGKLPSVKYRSGRVSVDLKTWKVTFTENTRVKVADKDYVYTGGKLYSGDTKTPASLPDPDSLYSLGLTYYSRGHYQLAIPAFQEYLRYYGETDRASDAEFYIGDSYYSQGNYKQSIPEYDECMARNPGGNKAAPAQLKKGFALLELGEKTAGVSELRSLIQRYPNSHEADLARQKLRRLSVGPPPR
jgi:tol-pal system protein YbgF